MIGEEIIFDTNIILRILSYDARLQKVYFKQKDTGVVSSNTTKRFLEFNRERIIKHFEKIQFKYEVGEIIKDEKRQLLILDKFKCEHKKYYKVKCMICSYNDIVEEYSLKEHKYSCSCCHGKRIVEGVNDIPTTDPWMIPYFQGGIEEARLYTIGSSAEIYFKCPYCNQVKENAIKISSLSARKKLNCVCMDYISYPEKFMRNFLSSNNVDYMYQVGKSYFQWCKNYIYDFYIPSKNIIIETHGEQHYTHTFGKITLEEQKRIDEEKQLLAENNGFLYIVIDCRKSDATFIYKNIKDSNLMGLLNISSNIDLKELENKCRSNTLKEICSDYNNSISIMPKDLVEKYKLNISTIQKYLHIGTELGWCNYNPKINLKIGQEKSRNIMTNRKRAIYGNILVFDDNGQLIGKFENQYETSKELKNIGLSISVSGVGQALKRKNHKSKNLYFYYENEIEA